MKLFSRFHVPFLALPLLLLVASTVIAGDDDWRPVTQAELEMKTPKVEADADADAEAIFWEVRVDDSKEDLSRVNYVRVKIFTDRGRQRFSKYDIPFVNGISIKDIEARVIKPDRSVVLLKKEDIFEKEIIRIEGIKVKVKSFAMPGLEVGSILEYRYREVSDFGLQAMPLIFQRDIPIETISYYVRPSRGAAGMYAQRFNVGDTWFEDDKKGYKRVTMNNVPAFKREPDMLPENEVRAWMYVYYSTTPNIGKPAEYWRWVNSGWYESSKKWTVPDDSLKQPAADIIAGAKTEDEKLKKIYEFVVGKIRNTRFSQGITPEERKRAAEDPSFTEILKSGVGTPSQIDFLFGALAAAAGFEVHAAYTGNRNDLSFDPNVAHFRLTLTQSLVAVKTTAGWRFFTPSSLDVPYGMLTWMMEDQTGMITTAKGPEFVKIPLSATERTAIKRSGSFKLLPDGGLEGDARIEFTGHIATYYKAINRGDTQEQKEQALKDFVRGYMSNTAEIENMKIEGVDDGRPSFIYTFKMRVPNYSARTGKRLFFQPNIFARNMKARYSASTRRSDIYFHYPWLEQDNFTIEFPAGFTLENADSPAPIMDGGGIGRHETQIGTSKDGKMINYRRQFSFGNGGAIRFGVEMYPAIKAMFDSFNKADVHQMILKETAGAPAN